MTKDEFFEHLRDMEDRFYVSGSGTIRHEDLYDENGDNACPIEAVRYNLGPVHMALGGELDNERAFDHGVLSLGLSRKDAGSIVLAADAMHDPLCPSDREDRRRMLEVLKLEDS